MLNQSSNEKKNLPVLHPSNTVDQFSMENINSDRKAMDVVNSIQERQSSINIDMSEMNDIGFKILKKAIDQGKDLTCLKQEFGYTIREMATMTGLSTGTISEYITISKDKRIPEALVHHSEQVLAIGQKNLVRLTKLDDEHFEKSLLLGKVVAQEKSVVIEVDHIETKKISEEYRKISKKYSNIRILHTEIQTIISNYVKHGRGDAVEQLDMDGVFIAIYPNAKVAQDETGVDKSSIYRVCKNEMTHAGNYIWRYPLFNPWKK